MRRNPDNPSCPICKHDRTRKQYKRKLNRGGFKQVYQCCQCNHKFTPNPINSNYQFISKLTKFEASKSLTEKRFVVTSAQNNTRINTKFFKALENYCKLNKARLIIVPCKYVLDSHDVKWDPVLLKYMVTYNVQLSKKLRLLAGINLLPTLDNPLTGLDYLSKGDSLIIGHQQMQMRALAVNLDDASTIMTTTGTVTCQKSSKTKAGLKADFNHSFSAIVVEKELDIFHFRTLNADSSGGFYDISGYYTGTKFTPDPQIDAILLGDTHAVFIDGQIKSATYTNKQSIVNVLKPKLILHGDLLDCFSISHHHKNNFFTRYGKHISGMDNLEVELQKTIKLLRDTTPEYSKLIMVASNHNDHLRRWLNEADPKYDPQNAKLYHHLMYLMLDSAKTKNGLTSFDDPFEIYVKMNAPELNIEFLKRGMSFKVHDIEMANHGDEGVSGARGSPMSFAKLPFKNTIGHGHSAYIEKGCQAVGTSSFKKLDYTGGLSKWTHTHGIVYPNGKRQLINIIEGRWNACHLFKTGANK